MSKEELKTSEESGAENAETKTKAKAKTKAEDKNTSKEKDKVVLKKTYPCLVGGRYLTSDGTLYNDYNKALRREELLNK